MSRPRQSFFTKYCFYWEADSALVGGGASPGLVTEWYHVFPEVGLRGGVSLWYLPAAGLGKSVRSTARLKQLDGLLCGGKAFLYVVSLKGSPPRRRAEPLLLTGGLGHKSLAVTVDRYISFLIYYMFLYQSIS